MLSRELEYTWRKGRPNLKRPRVKEGRPYGLTGNPRTTENLTFALHKVFVGCLNPGKEFLNACKSYQLVRPNPDAFPNVTVAVGYVVLKEPYDEFLNRVRTYRIFNVDKLIVDNNLLEELIINQNAVYSMTIHHVKFWEKNLPSVFNPKVLEWNLGEENMHQVYLVLEEMQVMLHLVFEQKNCANSSCGEKALGYVETRCSRWDCNGYRTPVCDNCFEMETLRGTARFCEECYFSHLREYSDKKFWCENFPISGNTKQRAILDGMTREYEKRIVTGKTFLFDDKTPQEIMNEVLEIKMSSKGEPCGFDYKLDSILKYLVW